MKTPFPVGVDWVLLGGGALGLHTSILDLTIIILQPMNRFPTGWWNGVRTSLVLNDLNRCHGLIDKLDTLGRDLVSPLLIFGSKNLF